MADKIANGDAAIFEAPYNMLSMLAQGYGGMAMAGAAFHEQIVGVPGSVVLIASPILLKAGDLSAIVFHSMTEKKAAKSSHFKLALSALIPGAQLLARAVDRCRGTGHYLNQP